MAIHGLYGVFSWTFSSFGPSLMLSCFHIHVKSFAYFEGLVRKLGQHLPRFQTLTCLQVAHLWPSGYNSVYLGYLNWSRNDSMRGLMSDLKQILGRYWTLGLRYSENAPRHKVNQRGLVVPLIQLGSFGSGRVEPSDLVVGLGAVSFLHNPSVNTSASCYFSIFLI